MLLGPPPRRPLSSSTPDRHTRTAAAKFHGERDILSNQNIDVFIAHIVGTSFDGLAGGIPGPTSHHGRSSGVVVDKHGYVDAGGVKHMDVDYHGMVMAHEVGHYLGLSHIDEAHNLMLWNSDRNDTNLNYDPQYRTMIRHGWLRID